MNTGSIIVLSVLFALVALAIWRNIRKGAPCSCGASHKNCTCGCCCCDGDEKDSKS